MDKISSYDAKHENAFEVPSYFKIGEMTKCSAVEKLANLINTDWTYSIVTRRSPYNCVGRQTEM